MGSSPISQSKNYTTCGTLCQAQKSLGERGFLRGKRCSVDIKTRVQPDTPVRMTAGISTHAHTTFLKVYKT
jgi:hypothetical protein